MTYEVEFDNNKLVRPITYIFKNNRQYCMHKQKPMFQINATQYKTFLICMREYM